MPRDHGKIMGQDFSPQDIVSMALESNCRSISYTYTEPTIYYELAKDTMIEAKKHGIYNVFVTNGFMSPEMLEDSKGLIDAANVDLKAFTPEFYTKYCKAKLDGVLDSLKRIRDLGIWLEVTTLLIPTLNDDWDEISGLASFIKRELGADVPWHVSRFYPQYREQGLPPTDVEFLRKVRQLGIDKGLYYVYTGNVPWDPGEKTYCPGCGIMLIDRNGYKIDKYALKDGACPKCGYKPAGVGL
jgi:pyruvate formate lyase activating enzyme